MTKILVTSSGGLDLTTLSLSSLAHLCRKSTDLFFQGVDYDDSSCFELFRRATQEEDDLAWEIVVNQYTNLVISWVQRHPSYFYADEEREYFVNRTFDNFWRAFSGNPEKLQKFNDVKSILQYLKLCTNSAVKEYVDRQMRPQGLSLSEKPIESIPSKIDPIGRIDEKIAANRLWQYILGLVKNEQEKIVAEDYFIYDLKPREIYVRHKEAFSTVSQVSRVKDNFIARLKRDDELAAILSGDD